MVNEIYFNLLSKSRREIREEVVNLFLREEAGTGNKELTSKYIYYVEQTSSGQRIFLQRPAKLNKGFDFIIKVENINFRDKGADRDAPRHKDIIDDLINKKSEDHEKYSILYKYIERIYKCKEVDSLIYDELNFNSGYSCELILKLIKWFFIEQDITYWNYSGRAMLMSGIDEI